VDMTSGSCLLQSGGVVREHERFRAPSCGRLRIALVRDYVRSTMRRKSILRVAP
jgi:hypothetical protein